MKQLGIFIIIPLLMALTLPNRLVTYESTIIERFAAKLIPAEDRTGTVQINNKQLNHAANSFSTGYRLLRESDY
jgi:hypothetical protein